MSEDDAVRAVERPLTVTQLVAELRELGLPAGGELIVHASLSDRALASALAGLFRRWRDSAHRRLGADRPEDVTRRDDFASKSVVMQEFMEMVRRSIASWLRTASILPAYSGKVRWQWVSITGAWYPGGSRKWPGT